MIQEVFTRLTHHYGHFNWWPNHAPYHIMTGAILVQNTNWKNAQKAMDNLGELLTPQQIRALPLDILAEKIRPCGYYNQKALKLKAMTDWFARYQFNINQVRTQSLPVLREELLAVKGIGGETADVILTYAIEKPSFVIDAYTRRIFGRYGLAVPKSYEDFRAQMQATFSPNVQTYGYYHGLMVEHAQTFCLVKPQCQACPLSSGCQKVGLL